MTVNETPDPRIAPISEQDGFAIMPDRWTMDFKVSCGELSRFFLELKENARFMGTRCPSCGSVYFWPRSWCHDCYVDCEWQEVPTTGKLTLVCRVEVSLTDLRRDVPFYQGGVHIDGVRYPIAAIIDAPDCDSLYPGMRMRAEFRPPAERSGTPRDFHFVPDE